MKIPDEVEITLLNQQNLKLKQQLTAMIYLLEDNLEMVGRKLDSKQINGMVLKLRKKLGNRFREPYIVQI